MKLRYYYQIFHMNLCCVYVEPALMHQSNYFIIYLFIFQIQWQIFTQKMWNLNISNAKRLHNCPFASSFKFLWHTISFDPSSHLPACFLLLFSFLQSFTRVNLLYHTKGMRYGLAQWALDVARALHYPPYLGRRGNVKINVPELALLCVAESHLVCAHILWHKWNRKASSGAALSRRQGMAQGKSLARDRCWIKVTLLRAYVLWSTPARFRAQSEQKRMSAWALGLIFFHIPNNASRTVTTMTTDTACLSMILMESCAGEGLRAQNPSEGSRPPGTLKKWL